MAVRLTQALVVIGAVCLPCSSPADSPVFVKSEVQYLSPQALKDLPPDIVEALTARGCRIPQRYLTNQSDNVISGSFAQPEQKDWALLCSIDGVSHLQIFWGGDVGCASEIRQSLDDDWFQGQGNVDGRHITGFGRAIWSISPEEILETRDLGQLIPELITHEAIYDGFDGKHASALFCSQGQWYELQDKY